MIVPATLDNIDELDVEQIADAYEVAGFDRGYGRACARLLRGEGTGIRDALRDLPAQRWDPGDVPGPDHRGA